MAEISLEGKVAIVTGAGRGMGRCMALGLARAGARGITVTSANSPGEIAQVAGEIDAIAGPGTGHAVAANVGDADSCTRAVAETMDKFGALHILINNAGKGMRDVFAGQRGPFWEVTLKGWSRVIETNVNGPFLMARAAAHPMIEAGWGRIINISKSVDTMHSRASSPYGPSKAFLDAVTLSWAQDLDGTGVTANILLPGGLTDTTFSRPGTVERRRKSGGRIFDPDDMAAPAVWLASEQSGDYTGCRFNAGKWDRNLGFEDAARGAFEAAAFRAPKRQGSLARAWQTPEAPETIV